MGTHRSSDGAARKAKYQKQFDRTARNKAKHIEKMKRDNPNYPNKKEIKKEE